MTATLDDVTKRKTTEPTAEARAAEELVRRAREQGLSLTGPEGLLKQLTKTVLETALSEELTEHLGVLPGEEAAAHEPDHPLDPRLVIRRTLAGSIRKPRSSAYSANARPIRGSSASARSTTGAMLSGIKILKTPPKNAHAASQPAIGAARSWRKLRCT
jgi:hypothetical protein